MFDCIPFFNELDLLELRMNVLNDVVERFVIVESTTTYSGKPKPLHFVENDQRFKKFWPKIIYLVHEGIVAGSPGYEDPERWKNEFTWYNENRQRNTILKALEIDRPSDNLFVLCDTDEIPKPEKLLEAKELALSTGKPVGLALYQCMYWLNYAYIDGPQSRAAYVFNPYTLNEFHMNTFNVPGDPSRVRWHMVDPNCPEHFQEVKDAGWHFSCTGGVDQIKHKLESFSHFGYIGEEVKSVENMIKAMVRGEHIYENKFYPNTRLTIQDKTFLPKYVQDNLEQYQRHII